jgi:hypothetical protein
MTGTGRRANPQIAGAAHFLPAVLLGFLSTILATAPADAQERPHRVWLAAGVGGGGAYGGGDAAGVVFQGVYERAPHHYALRLVVLTGLPGTSADGFGEFGVLYGRFAAAGPAQAHAAAGLSAVYLDKCDDTHRDCIIPGVPLTVEVDLVMLEVIGLGVQLFGNINPKAPYGGLFVTVPIGWMPD